MVNFATLYIAPVHFPYSIAYISTQQNNNKQKHNIQMANIKDQQKRTESADALNKKEALFLKHKKTISIVIIAIIAIINTITSLKLFFFIKPHSIHIYNNTFFLKIINY